MSKDDSHINPRDFVLPLPESAIECGYFSDRKAVYEEYLIYSENESLIENMIQSGFRQFGVYFFRPGIECCGLCLPIRIPVNQFQLSASQRRRMNKCQNHEIKVTIGVPLYSPEKFLLYREHKTRFDQNFIDSEQAFQSTFYTHNSFILEFCYYHNNHLIGVGLMTKTPNIGSSIYFFFGAAGESMGIGTFSILYELAWCREQQIPYYYLGFYISGHRHMNYKESFRPSEIMTEPGNWQKYRDGRGNRLIDATEIRCKFKDKMITFPPIDREML